MADFTKPLHILSKPNVDWEVTHNALEKISAILKEQSHLCHEHTTILTRYALREAVNLRFAVAKAALKLLSRLLRAFGSKLDNDIDKIVACVLKKVGEKNGAMKESLERMTWAVCTFGTPTRVVFSLISYADHKNTAIRRAVVDMMKRCVMGEQDCKESDKVDKVPINSKCPPEKLYSHHEFEKLVFTLWQLTRDGLGDTRNDAKLVLYYICSRTPRDALEKTLYRSLSGPLISELLAFMTEFRRRSSLRPPPPPVPIVVPPKPVVVKEPTPKPPSASALLSLDGKDMRGSDKLKGVLIDPDVLARTYTKVNSKGRGVSARKSHLVDYGA
jgi:hypothetical protein